MNTSEVIESMVREIVTRFDPERIILFGSQARGDAVAESDVDLLVVMPDGVNRRKTAIAILNVLSDMPLPKDVLVTTAHEIATRGKVVATVLHNALSEGKELYAR